MRKRILFLFVSLLLAFPLAVPAQAVNPDEVLPDPALEERARELSIRIRCTVCQNQSIDDSDAPLARDLRILVREKLTEGATDREVLDFLVARYGEFILLQPRFGLHTLLLWLLPPVLLVVAIFAVRRLFSRSKTTEVPQEKLSAEEKRAVSQIIDPE